MKKKIIAIVLIICLVCGAIPLEVVAIETTNNTKQREKEKICFNSKKYCNLS